MSDARARAAWSQTASVLALMYNINRDPKKTRPLKPDDFNPYASKKSREDRIAISNLGELRGMFTNTKLSGEPEGDVQDEK